MYIVCVGCCLFEPSLYFCGEGKGRVYVFPSSIDVGTKVKREVCIVVL